MINRNTVNSNYDYVKNKIIFILKDSGLNGMTIDEIDEKLKIRNVDVIRRCINDLYTSKRIKKRVTPFGKLRGKRKLNSYTNKIPDVWIVS